MTSHEQHTHRILSELETGEGVSQRSLSRNLGIALGLTNLLIHKLVRKGFIRVIHIKPNRVRYLLTPAGIAEKARMSREVLQRNVQFYVQARDRIRQRFARLSAEWPETPGEHDQAPKPIVFYGAGEVAEIGYVCLQGTDLQLVGVIDDHASHFFDVPVYSRQALRPGTVDDQPYGRLIVMSFAETDDTRADLAELGFDREQVFWL